MSTRHSDAPSRLVPPDEALEIVLAHTPRLGDQRVGFTEAAERVLAEAVCARENMPPFPASTMDGFAVRSADTSPQRRLVGEQLAGYVSGLVVEPGSAVRITTGSPLPPGADAVIQLELVDERDGSIILQRPVPPGNNIRPVGSDIRAGEIILPAGSVLGPAEIGLLAGLGITEVAVSQQPRVALLSTGDELVEPGQTPPAGQIRDSNRFSLAVAVQRAGGQVVASGLVRDASTDLRRMMMDGLAQADVLITSGGVSMGKLDLVKGLIEELGEVLLRRLFMKPGKPCHVAAAPGKLIFGLPGNPVSSLVAFELLIRPALRVMQGATNWQRLVAPVELAHDIRSADDRIEYQRGIVQAIEGRLVARNTGPQGSARLASLVGANALLVLPPRSHPYYAGEQVQALLLDTV